MPLQCEFVGGVETEHVNHRKTDPGDPEVLAVDLKMTGQLDWEVLAKILCCSVSEINNLWHDELRDEDQTPRFPMQKKIELSNIYRDHQLNLGDHKFVGVEIKKLSYEFKKHRRFLLTFSATIQRPTDEEVVFFSHILKDKVACSIGCDPDMFEELQDYENKMLLKMMMESRKRQKREHQDDMFSEDTPHEGEEEDPLYQQAVDYVRESNRPAMSSVQRFLKIGYNRAARLLEQMEKDGVVTAMNEAGQREVIQEAAELE